MSSKHTLTGVSKNRRAQPKSFNYIPTFKLMCFLLYIVIIYSPMLYNYGTLPTLKALMAAISTTRSYYGILLKLMQYYNSSLAVLLGDDTFYVRLQALYWLWRPTLAALPPLGSPPLPATPASAIANTA